MKFEPRYKFYASLDASGDITPGAAVAGYQSHALASDAIGYHILLEEPSTSEWQLCLYDPNASAGARRTMVHESASALTYPLTGLIASLIAPETAYAAVSGSTASPYVDSNYSLAVGGGSSVSSSSDESVAVGVTSESRAPSGTALGYAAITGAGYSVAVGNGAYSDGAYSTVVGWHASANSYAAGNSNGVNLFGAKTYAAMVGESVIGSSLRPHVSFIPIRAVSGVDAGAGTYAFEAFDGEGNSSTVTGTLVRASGGGALQGVRIQGTIAATATSGTHHRVWDIDYFIDASPAVRASAFTVQYTGGAGTMTIAVSSAGALTITTSGAYAGLVVSGLLTASKIVY